MKENTHPGSAVGRNTRTLHLTDLWLLKIPWHFWQQQQCSGYSPAAIIPWLLPRCQVQFDSCSIPLYPILNRPLPDVNKPEGQRSMPISPFGKMLFILSLGNSLSSRNTSPIEQHIPSPLSIQPPEQALPALGILQCKVIEGTWVKQVLSHLFSLHLPCAPGLCPSSVL